MKDNNGEIKFVLQNKVKCELYKQNWQRFNRAKESKFYLECMWILYAMLEDRSSAFFYHLGFTKTTNRNAVTSGPKLKKQIRQILDMAPNNNKYGFSHLVSKLTRIIDVVKWSRNAEPSTDYQNAVKKVVDRFATNQTFLDAIKYLNENWRKKRNLFAHALLLYDAQDAYEQLVPLIEHGCLAIRELDKVVSAIKRAKIREKFKLE